MSLIASFHTIDAAKLNDLLKAAVPEIKITEKKGFFSTKKVEERIDHFDEYLVAQATLQEEFQFDGSAFNDLDLLLEGKGCMLTEQANGDLSKKLSDARESTYFVFLQADAAKLLKLLAGISISNEDIRKYFQEEYPAEDSNAGTEALAAALTMLKKWLASVSSSQIGLLSIG